MSGQFNCLVSSDKLNEMIKRLKFEAYNEYFSDVYLVFSDTVEEM